ncbi:hypothetical protein HRbin35_00527 [bacterium HR35]|nr:hypothetical protein HRbin35_00527 [bacterium HR35]
MKKQLILTIFLSFVFFVFLITYLNERKKNEPYKKNIEILKNQIIKSKEESWKLSLKSEAFKHPLEIEKERKENFGESLKNEKVLFISEEILKNIEFKK